jgi:hypothetical protein
LMSHYPLDVYRQFEYMAVQSTDGHPWRNSGEGISGICFSLSIRLMSRTSPEAARLKCRWDQDTEHASLVTELPLVLL